MEKLARRGFSLVEALVAVTILGLAGSAILLAASASAAATADAFERTVAGGIAKTMIDEMMGLPYKEKAAHAAEEWSLSIEPEEASDPPRRSLFDDIDDYNGYESAPPVDPWLIPLGSGDGSGGWRPPLFRLPQQFFQDWSVMVSVKYLDESDLSELPAGTSSGIRAVEVQVGRGEGVARRTLARARRVVTHMPVPAS
jgi:prepilin-type N-terminal cleavage/methylation domain-containing protein